jgi:hypothetical protein
MKNAFRVSGSQEFLSECGQPFGCLLSVAMANSASNVWSDGYTACTSRKTSLRPGLVGNFTNEDSLCQAAKADIS